MKFELTCLLPVVTPSTEGNSYAYAVMLLINADLHEKSTSLTWFATFVWHKLEVSWVS